MCKVRLRLIYWKKKETGFLLHSIFLWTISSFIDREYCLFSQIGFLYKSQQWQRLGQAEAKSQELKAGYPCGWQALSSLSHCMLPLMVSARKLGLRCQRQAFSPATSNVGHGHPMQQLVQKNKYLSQYLLYLLYCLQRNLVLSEKRVSSFKICQVLFAFRVTSVLQAFFFFFLSSGALVAWE